MNDEELQGKIEEAKAAGYTDEQIQAYLDSQKKTDEDKSNAVASPWVDRAAEHEGLVEGGLAKAAEYGAEGYVGYKALKGIGKAFSGKGPVAPTPAAPTPTPAPAAPAPTVGKGPVAPTPVAETAPAPTSTSTRIPGNYAGQQYLGKDAGPAFDAKTNGDAMQQRRIAERPWTKAPPTAPTVQAAPISGASPTATGAAAEAGTFISRMLKVAGPAAALVGGLTYSPGLNTGEDEEVKKMKEYARIRREMGVK
jgi:hypothetical protein